MKSTIHGKLYVIGILAAAFIIAAPTNAQNLYREILAHRGLAKSKSYPLFRQVKSLHLEDRGPETATISLEIQSSVKENIQKTKPEVLEILLPVIYQDKQMELWLKRFDLLPSSHPSGLNVFYHGVLKDKPNSMVSLNITTSGISGLLADETGHYLITPSDNRSSESLFFKEQPDQSRHSFNCHTNTENHHVDTTSKSGSVVKSANTSYDTLYVYIECDYAMFLNNNASINETRDYMLGLVNEVAAIYYNESIVLQISDYRIWDIEDPYSDASAGDALVSFQQYLGSQFNGQLAHLMSGSPNNNGGQAVINTLCNKSTAHSYANIEGHFETGMTYSWDVHVVAHELGHNLGSPHTHDCVWGPGEDSALDDCATGGSCAPGPSPLNGGTIMSYCHTTEAGINFSLGFGSEPGDLIRNAMGSCQDYQGFICSLAEELTGSGTQVAIGPSFGEGATHPPARHANWYYISIPANGTLHIRSCGQGVDTRLFLYEGPCEDLTLVASSDDDCISSNGYHYASIIEEQPVEAGKTYYIEWDDRWAEEGFDFEYRFTPSDNICENAASAPAIITNDSGYHSDSDWQYDGLITNTASALLSSASGLRLDNGFTVDNGSELRIQIETCEEFQSSSNE